MKDSSDALAIIDRSSINWLILKYKCFIGLILEKENAHIAYCMLLLVCDFQEQLPKHKVAQQRPRGSVSAKYGKRATKSLTPLNFHFLITHETQAIWIQVPPTIKKAVETLNYSFRGGLHAAGHALLNVIPMYIVCNSSDLASECVNPYDSRNVPERILLYDPHPGGTGISAQVQHIFSELLTAALELLSSCRCSGDTGCPNCVQNISCHEYNEVLHKECRHNDNQGCNRGRRILLQEYIRVVLDVWPGALLPNPNSRMATVSLRNDLMFKCHPRVMAN